MMLNQMSGMYINIKFNYFLRIKKEHTTLLECEYISTTKCSSYLMYFYYPIR